MRLIKLALISIVILFLVLLGFSLFIPSRTRVSRAINIGVSRDSVMQIIGNIPTWKSWNELVKSEGLSGQQFRDSSFSSDQLVITIHQVSADTLRTTWTQKDGKIITGDFTLDGQGNTTVIQWYFDFKLRWYPWEKLGSIIYDKQLGPMMERSLDQLRRFAERGTQ